MAEPSSNPEKFYNRPFLSYLRANPRSFVLGVISIFFTDLFDILTPLALKAGIDALEKNDSSALLNAIGVYAILMVCVTVFRYSWRIYFGRYQHAVAEDLRNRIFDKLLTLGPSFYQRSTVGSLMSLLTNDVNTFRMAIGPGVLILLDAAFYTGMIVPVMISLSWDWTWKTLILLPLVPFFMRKMENLIHDRWRVQQDRLSEMSGRAQEIISGIRPIKGFAQEDHQAASFNKDSLRFEDACNKVAVVDSAFHPVMDFSVATGAVILLWLCSPDVLRGDITLGTFVAFHEYIRRMIWPMSALGFGVGMMEQGRASFDRIRELLATETDIPDLSPEEGAVSLERFESLEIKGLSFRYSAGAGLAVKNLSLEIRAGETIGLVGPVGAGKTTLLQLICRLFPSDSGAIRLNGVELERVSRASLSRLISLVPQDAFLFSDTISENVAFGFSNFPGLEPVEEAATTVNLDQEIRRLPDGYSAALGERGVNLSGGQKQRMTIARALIRQSNVVMFDDSLSAVDSKTEQLIVGALREGRRLHPHQTVVLVSHRLATLKHADRIVVLNQGEIEAVGTHDELVTKSPTYKRLRDLQATSDATIDDAGVAT